MATLEHYHDARLLGSAAPCKASNADAEVLPSGIPIVDHPKENWY